MMAAQENALKANEILMANIVGENLQYPDYYGGVYIEDNILHIQLAGASSETSTWISQLLSEYSDWVTIENVDHSYNDLYSLAETSAYSLCNETNDYEITGFYVDILLQFLLTMY